MSEAKHAGARERQLRIFLQGAELGYRCANTNYDLRRTLDEAEKIFAKAKGVIPSEV